jgi:hypothetical protein
MERKEAAMPPHCDSLDGPVVNAARRALEANDPGAVLPYVPKEGEDEVLAAFERTTTVRPLSPQARELADLAFFEIVVRIHREGEGAPYTGLKPAGLDVGPVIPVVERAAATGDASELADLLVEELRHEIEHRLRRVKALESAADVDVDHAREHVEAMLGLEVWAHSLHESIHAEAHEHTHAHA